MARGEYSNISPCLKWTLFIFNFVFWIFGLLLSAAGAYGVYFTAVEHNGQGDKLEQAYIVITDLSAMLLALGMVIWLVSYAGCIGALRENLCLLKFYFWTLTLILILELVIAISCIVFPWKSRSFVEWMLSDRLVQKYMESDNTKDLVDTIQSSVECCGMTNNGYLDWNLNEYFNCSESSPSVQRCGVPPSCCRNYLDPTAQDNILMCGYDAQKLKTREAGAVIYTRGCVTAIIQLLESNLYVAAGVIFAITLFQMYVTHQARTLLDQIQLQRAHWKWARRISSRVDYINHVRTPLLNAA